MTRGLQRGGTQYVGLAQSRPSQPLQFIVVAETAQPGIGADQHGDARTMRGTGQRQSMREVGFQHVFAAQAWVVLHRGLQIVAPRPAGEWIQIGQARIVDEGRIACARVFLAGDVGRHERCSAGLHQSERFAAEGWLVAADHPFGQRGRVFAIERATAPRRRVVEAVAYEQMGVLEAALAGLQRGFQWHGPGQVADQRATQLLCLGGQPLVGIGTQPVVDLQCVNATRA
ncbi:hypothetical protein G6F24_014721 [Rhizopus arrhizus]|nr:hypothetical protein G6F24_014721 [Rhizopus arrhizus]